MGKRIGIGLLCLGAMVAMRGDAVWAAGVKCGTTSNCTQPYYWKSGGTTCCTCLKVGSVVMTADIGALGGRFCSSSSDVDCGVMGLTLWGTEDTDTYNCPNSDDPTYLDENCGLSMAALYKNKGGKFNFNVNAQPFVKPGPESATGTFDFFDKNGNASLTLELEFTGEVPPPQNPNWTFLDVLFLKFKAQKTNCPGGYDVLDQCCAFSDRVGGACSTLYGEGLLSEGQPLTELQLCVHPDISNSQPGLPYDCTQPAAECGGLTGVFCVPPIEALP